MPQPQCEWRMRSLPPSTCFGTLEFAGIHGFTVRWELSLTLQNLETPWQKCSYSIGYQLFIPWFKRLIVTSKHKSFSSISSVHFIKWYHQMRSGCMIQWYKRLESSQHPNAPYCGWLRNPAPPKGWLKHVETHPKSGDVYHRFQLGITGFRWPIHCIHCILSPEISVQKSSKPKHVEARQHRHGDQGSVRLPWTNGLLCYPLVLT